MKKKECKVLSTTGSLGSGFKESSLKIGLSWGPEMIGADGGSTDPGPHYLGSGESMFSDEAFKKEIGMMIKAGRSSKIPVIIGSCGTSGINDKVDSFIAMVQDISKKENLHFKLGAIYSEQDKEYLINKLREGKVQALKNAPEFTEENINKSKHIVGMAGVEPFIECLDNGADVIIAGRSSDTSIFAAVPLMNGINPGPVWHAAKILECGAGCVAQRKYPDCMFGVIRDDEFIVKPPNPEYRCTPVSVASHMLYENSSPFEIIEPTGIMNCTDATYEALDERSVRVKGSHFTYAETYTIKLEGAESIGYQSLFIGSIRDPYILSQLENYLEGMRKQIEDRIAMVFGDHVLGRFDMHFRVYGLNGAMGILETNTEPAHEVCLVIQITAENQKLASSLCKSASHIAIHYPIPEWSGLITSFALPYSPMVIDRGEVFRFNVNHVVKPDNYKEMFQIRYQSL